MLTWKSPNSPPPSICLIFFIRLKNHLNLYAYKPLLDLKERYLNRCNIPITVYQDYEYVDLEESEFAEEEFYADQFYSQEQNMLVSKKLLLIAQLLQFKFVLWVCI